MVHADDLDGRPSGIGQGPQQIEDRADADLMARAHGVFHGTVKQRREEKPDADLVHALFGPLG